MNVLKKGYIDAWNAGTSDCAETENENRPYIKMQFKAQTVIGKIVLIPPVDVGSYHQDIDVVLRKYDGTEYICGNTSPSIFINYEFDCGG